MTARSIVDQQRPPMPINDIGTNEFGHQEIMTLFGQPYGDMKLRQEFDQSHGRPIISTYRDLNGAMAHITTL